MAATEGQPAAAHELIGAAVHQAGPAFGVSEVGEVEAVAAGVPDDGVVVELAGLPPHLLCCTTFRELGAATPIPWNPCAWPGSPVEVAGQGVGRCPVEAGAAVVVAAGGPGVGVAELVLDVFESGAGVAGQGGAGMS